MCLGISLGKKGFHSGILLGKRDFTRGFGLEKGISFADLARKRDSTRGYPSGMKLGKAGPCPQSEKGDSGSSLRDFSGKMDFARGFGSEEGILLGDFARKKGFYSAVSLGKRDFTRRLCSEKGILLGDFARKMLGQKGVYSGFCSEQQSFKDQAQKRGDCA